MRKLSLFLLLATAAAPALAAGDRDNDRAERRAERRAAASEQSESRPQRVRADRPERSQPSDQGSSARARQNNRDGAGSGSAATATQAQTQDDVSARALRRSQREGNRNRETLTQTEQATGALAPRQRQIRTIPDTQPTATQSTATGRRGGEIARAWLGEKRRDYRDGNYSRWSRDWHRDRRYDWRRHRDRHRSLFRLGFYYDPFGWSYNRWSIGSFLYPSYFGSRYWLNDPWQYRLPPAYGPYRWVRYWDDALLVNIYTGEVVDVMHNFFW